MAQTIKPKRSSVAGNVPTTSNITQYEIAMNTADKKVYTSDGTNIIQLASGNLTGLADVAVSSVADGDVMTYSSSTGKWSNAVPAAGGVTTGKAIAMAIVFGG